MIVDIVCATFNGASYLHELLESVQRQSHRDWRLWIRDDGSTDDTIGILRAAADSDERIRLLHAGGPPSGATRAFGWLLEQVPADAAYIMCADQDDVWLPEKVGLTLAAMRAAELQSAPGTPILVHTDLTVVDAGLNVVHPSFREFSDRPPEPVTMRRLIAKNIVTGAAMMINRPLLQLALPIPVEAYLHDWWLACVAAALGRTVSVNQSTVLYRQHGANVVGARDERLTWRSWPRLTLRSLRQNAKARDDLRRIAAQAAALHARFGQRLSEADERVLSTYAGISKRSAFSRKLALIRLGSLPEHGSGRRMLRAFSVLLRG